MGSGASEGLRRRKGIAQRGLILLPPQMNKRAIIRKITAKLVSELEIYFRAAQFSRAEATHESSKAENKYDTRGLEAAYLAGGQARQARELVNSIAAYEKLAIRAFSGDDPIDLAALVELEADGNVSTYFIGPRNGGLEV